MNNANTAIYDKVVDRAAMLRLYERSVAKKILATLMEHENTANEIIAANNAKFDKKLQEAIDAQISKTYKELYSTSSRSLLDLVTDQVSYAYQTLETAVGNIWKTQKPNRRVAEDLVLNNPLFNNVVLSAGWTGIGVAERKRIESTIRRGIAQGLNEKEIALAVRKGNIFNISRNQSIGLSRTAITSVYAQADQQVYEANKGILAGWQYVAVLDSRTTPLCAHRDGKIYPVDDKRHLPPAHWHCRSTTVPVVKNWADLKDAKNIAQIRKRNLQNLTDEEKAFYDGMTPSKESYDAWLRRQPPDVQLKHFGDTQKLKLFQQGQLTVDKFSDNGRDLSLKELRSQTDPEYGIPGDTRKFAFAKEQLESLAIGASRPEDFYGDKKLTEALKDYYRLQAGDLNGTLSYTDYRGTLVHVKRATKQRVLSTPPTEDNLKFNPLTNKYEDARLYQPAPAVLQNNLRLVKESEKLLPEDKEFIESFVNSLETTVSLNQRAVITDNLRITFSRYRDNQIPWNNLKAVLNGQMKFDVMNVSDYIETQLRKDRDILANLKKMEFVDPVLGPTSLQDLHDTFIDNIFERKSWEFSEAPKIARRLRNVLDRKIPPKIWVRLDDADLKEFYLNFAKRLAFSDTPDRDQLAIYLGRDLYNLANYRGTRNEWYNLGVKLLDDAKDKGFYELETYGVQKRRMKSRIGGNYFGPVYETPMVVIRITDPKIRKFAILTRKVDLGLRVGVTTGKNRLVIRPGYKTYFDVKNRDTGIPIVSADSMSYFPDDMIDENMAEALNWAAKSEFKVDKDYYEAIKRLLYFKDDKGKAKYYDELNEYRKHIVSRGDSYERFKAMEWLVENDSAFSNHPFIDHRARIYDRGFIGPQAGETFRPFLNTAKTKSFSPEDFQNLQDHIGAFLGGLSDKLEGNYNSLTVLGRQKVAEKWRPELIKIGDHLRRGKPNDLRAVLESEMLAEIDGEDMGKTLRFAIEMSKIKEFLEQSRKTPKEGVFSKNNLVNLKNYQTGLALEQDASSSGAQIIALTTRNKKLAELSNVIPTNQKKRLYDEIAAATFNDPRFREINKRLGLTEKDLRKAAKAQNMVTFNN
jgi:SPP1 gp7 family putative phage head morphogenesis protein